MKKLLLLFTSSISFLLCFSQKGLPPGEASAASVNTFYPDHEDFKESMLSRIKVPSGFTVSIAATGLGKPRMMEMAGKNAVYVTRRDQGDVLLLKDTDGDGRFDEMKTVVKEFKGVHGITQRNNYLYLISNMELKRYRINADYTLSDTVTLIKDLPDGGQHGNRTIAFGPDGKLYISVGSDCNDCNETNPEHATLLQVNMDDIEHRKIFARGLRNTIGFDWNPQTGDLWGMDNGTDWRGEEIPPEELNKIMEGTHYGWPLVFGKRVVDPTREDPPGSTKAEFAKTTEPATMVFPAHGAPINFKFYRGDALVSWHGSWNRKKPEGYKVQRIHFINGQPAAAEDFFSGLLNKEGTKRFGRPAGIAISPDGSVLISDDESGVIYRVKPNN